MMEQDIFDKIKEASKDVIVTPSSAVWDKLESRLKEDRQAAPPPAKVFQLFDLKKWSIAASVLVLIGAYGVLNHLGNRVETSTAIQLEDLHTLEVNPRYNVAPLGESSTIPIIHSLNASYKTINEGSADKKLKKRSTVRGNDAEYGLG